MNPEEGHLRPQILDRFGLRVVVKGLEHKKQRLEAYRRSIAFVNSPRQFIKEYREATERIRQELAASRESLPEVQLTSQAENFGLKMIQELRIDSLRAEITLFESARAYAIADGRLRATPKDIRRVAPMTLRLRRSEFIKDFFSSRAEEEEEIDRILTSLKRRPSKRKRKTTKS
jgi:magnesium chelatase subunit I